MLPALGLIKWGYPDRLASCQRMETNTAGGHINGKTGSFTGTNGKPVAPTVAGVFIGLDTSTGGGIEVCTGCVELYRCHTISEEC